MTSKRAIYTYESSYHTIIPFGGPYFFNLIGL
jgi:hypothetical protein